MLRWPGVGRASGWRRTLASSVESHGPAHNQGFGSADWSRLFRIGRRRALDRLRPLLWHHDWESPSPPLFSPLLCQRDRPDQRDQYEKCCSDQDRKLHTRDLAMQLYGPTRCGIPGIIVIIQPPEPAIGIGKRARPSPRVGHHCIGRQPLKCPEHVCRPDATDK